MPNGFDLLVQLALLQERDRSRLIQFDRVCRPCLEQFGAVRFMFTLRDTRRIMNGQKIFAVVITWGNYNHGVIHDKFKNTAV